MFDHSREEFWHRLTKQSEKLPGKSGSTMIIAVFPSIIEIAVVTGAIVFPFVVTMLRGCFLIQESQELFQVFRIHESFVSLM
jgi:hypothetical protein